MKKCSKLFYRPTKQFYLKEKIKPPNFKRIIASERRKWYCKNNKTVVHPVLTL